MEKGAAELLARGVAFILSIFHTFRAGSAVIWRSLPLIVRLTATVETAVAGGCARGLAGVRVRRVGCVGDGHFATIGLILEELLIARLLLNRALIVVRNAFLGDIAILLLG